MNPNEEYYLCSEACIETMQPKERSKYLIRIANKVAVAKIDFDEAAEMFKSLDEDQKAYFWCQEIEAGFIDIESFDIKKHRGKAFFDWMLDDVGLSKLNNHAIIIHLVSVQQQMNPIELFNELAKK